MLEPKAPPSRNGPNTGSLAPGVIRRVNRKKTVGKTKNNTQMAITREMAWLPFQKKRIGKFTAKLTFLWYDNFGEN